MIEHMFALYFYLEYQIFQTLSREQFLSDLRTGTHRYCSHLLVNATLALGCRLSVQQDSQSNPDDERAAAGRFFAEEKGSLLRKDLQCCKLCGLCVCCHFMKLVVAGVAKAGSSLVNQYKWPSRWACTPKYRYMISLPLWSKKYARLHSGALSPYISKSTL